MSVMIVVAVLAMLILCVAGVVLALLGAGRLPEEGLLAWLRECVAAWRSDELGKDKLGAESAQEAHLEDLFTLGTPEEGSAYVRPEELTLHWEGVRHLIRR